MLRQLSNEEPAITTASPDGTAQGQNAVSHPVSKRSKGLEIMLLCCLSAGVVAFVKALEMEQATDGLLCLLGSGGACGLLAFLYLREG